jgi:hypothetical protein
VADFPAGASPSARELIATVLSACLRPHGLVREVRCLLCAAVLQQRYVGVALCEDGQPIGDLCPRCLGEPPARCAERVWARAARLWAEVGAALLRDASPLSGSAAEVERGRRAEDRRRREVERRLRAAGLLPAGPEAEPATRAEKEHMAELLLSLAQGLERLHEWPITPAELQEAERAAAEAHSRTDLPPPPA